MATTALGQLRYPVSGDAVTLWTYFQNLANDVDPKTIPAFATATARNTAYSSWVSQGNAMRDGLTSYTISDDRYWRYDTASSAWVYLGGAPPPIVLATVNGGFTGMSTHKPAVYRDGSGLVHVVGGVTNVSTYTPNGSNIPMTLPVGFRPTTASIAIAAVDSSPGTIVLTVHPDGTITLDSNGGVAIASGRAHYFDMIVFHPGYAGDALA